MTHRDERPRRSPYCLDRNRPAGAELRRVYEQQLSAAMACLSRNVEVDYGLRDCRKHVKKARAVLDTIAPHAHTREARHELRTAKLVLGELVDARGAQDVIDELRDSGFAEVDSETLRLRAALHNRTTSLERRAELRGDRVKVLRLLASAQARAANWDLAAFDAEALVGAVAAARKRSRHGRRAAAHHPSVETYHRWRRAVKGEWYLYRLIADHTGGGLLDEAQQLAAIGTRLGRLHDVDVLGEILRTESLLPREATARLLRVLRGITRDLRERARAWSVVLDDRPAAAARRARHLCRHDKAYAAELVADGSLAVTLDADPAMHQSLQ